MQTIGRLQPLALLFFTRLVVVPRGFSRMQSSDPFPASQNRSLKDVDRAHATSEDSGPLGCAPTPESSSVMLITLHATDCPAKSIYFVTLRNRPSFTGNTKFPAGVGFSPLKGAPLVPSFPEMRGVSPTHGLATD